MGQRFWSKKKGAGSTTEQESSVGDVSHGHKKTETGRNVRLSVCKPSSYDEGLKAADIMKTGSGVVINGEGFDPMIYQRVLDFLDGAAYVLEMTSRCISDNVQVYVPASMDIIDDTGSYYGNLSKGKKR